MAATAALGGVTGVPRAQAVEELGFLSAVELAGKLRRKEVGVEELARYFIKRIEQYDGKVNAVVVRDFERALAAANDADKASARGREPGPLHGLPMTIKESYDIAGLPSSWGVPDAAQDIAEVDSAVVERFKNAGAIFLGKTNVPYMLGDFQSYNDVYGTTNNPWDLERTPGGSSGGSAAALAAGLTGLESGSDIGGSIRNPAHCCGVYGHKPTWGIIPTRGHEPPGQPSTPQYQQDLSVVGPMARSAEDLAMALDILGGPNEFRAAGWRLALPPARMNSLKGLRVALWPDDPNAPVDSEVAARVEAIGKMLEKAGAKVSATARPAFDAKAADDTYLGILNGITSEAAAGFTFHEYEALHEQRGFFRTQWRQFFRDWDILVTPTIATPAFVQDQSDYNTRTLTVNGSVQPYFQQMFWAGLATLSYLPSTVFPTGLSSGGLPIGLQAIGAEYDDRTTIEFARLVAGEIGGYQPPTGYA